MGHGIVHLPVFHYPRSGKIAVSESAWYLWTFCVLPVEISEDYKKNCFNLGLAQRVEATNSGEQTGPSGEAKAASLA